MCVGPGGARRQRHKRKRNPRARPSLARGRPRGPRRRPDFRKGHQRRNRGKAVMDEEYPAFPSPEAAKVTAIRAISRQKLATVLIETPGTVEPLPFTLF